MTTLDRFIPDVTLQPNSQVFHLSKESKRVFLALLVVPLIWIAVNELGYLDYLKTKTLDWQLREWRGEISHREAPDADDKVTVEGNQTVPRVPKVTYVNFDAGTLAMDGVGERPWDRAFFRDVAMVLLERAKARVVAFDFLFSPKSASSMVPAENVHRSDGAIGELVAAYPDRVVLGAGYTGVQTSLMRASGAPANPPFFKDGYVQEEAAATGKIPYPEAPTYPMQSYRDGKYLGRLGSITVVPYREVDNVPRWVPLWFSAGGKAHAYNVLGGKKTKLALDLRTEGAERVAELVSELQDLNASRREVDARVVERGASVGELAQGKEALEEEIESLRTRIEKARDGEHKEGRKQFKADHAEVEKLKADMAELDVAIENFRNTLEANPAIAAVVEPQLKVREAERSKMAVKLAELEGSDEVKEAVPAVDPAEVEKLKADIAELDVAIGNFRNTLEANPAIAAVVEPQLKARESERAELVVKLAELEGTPADPETPVEVDEVILAELEEELAEKEEALEEITSELLTAAAALSEARAELDELTESLKEKQGRLWEFRGESETELVEAGDVLRLIYKQREESEVGVLVDSLPNEMPLNRERRHYTLGVESLLAYYGLEDDAVVINDGNDRLRIVGRDGEELVSAPMSDGQFVEVNWFSKWGEPIPEVTDLKEARKLYGEESFEDYVKLAPTIIRGFLERVKDFEVPSGNADLPEALLKLGVEEEHAETARGFLRIAAGDAPAEKAPEFARLLALTNAIDYYFLPVGLASPFNPMCGMKDVLRYDQFHRRRSGDLEKIDAMIARIEGEFLPKVQAVLEQKPGHEQALAKMEEAKAALATNRAEREKVLKEIELFDAFFAKFENAIVFIGPEEKTFQDLAPTPFDIADMPKVGVHGNLVKTLTSGLYLKRLPTWVDHLATIGFCVVLAFIAVYQGPKSSWVQGGGLLAQAGCVVIACLVFAETHIVWPVVTPNLAGLSTSFFGVVVMVVIEQKAKGKLKGMFGSYVSSDLVEQMVESGEEPSLGGEETQITAFFSDVQAFSSFSELLSPTGLVDLMNEYLTAMTNILQDERGTLDKYIGDAIVAMYGAPIPMDDHAYQSVRTAILMQQKQIELREKWKSEGDKWPDIVARMQTRIGCNTGTATVGNMGALDRFNYTMMGDMVNLAARCESGAKAYGAYIMITEETKVAAETTRDDIAYRYLDKIVVKGRTQPVAMYEPTGFMAELTQETQDCLDCFRQGIDRYLVQDWDGALKLFEKAKEMEPNKPGVTPGVVDNPSMILIDRCQVMKDNPPGDDWDGVYVMTTK